MGQQFDDSFGSARHEFFLAGCQPSFVDRVESIHVLVGNYSLNKSVLIKTAWQRKLNKDPVNFGIRVQLTEQSFKLVLRRVCRQMMILGPDSHVFGGFVFAS